MSNSDTKPNSDKDDTDPELERCETDTFSIAPTIDPLIRYQQTYVLQEELNQLPIAHHCWDESDNH